MNTSEIPRLDYNHEEFAAIFQSLPLVYEKRTRVMELDLEPYLMEYYRCLFLDDFQNQMDRLVEACMIYFMRYQPK